MDKQSEHRISELEKEIIREEIAKVTEPKNYVQHESLIKDKYKQIGEITHKSKQKDKTTNTLAVASLLVVALFMFVYAFAEIGSNGFDASDVSSVVSSGITSFAVTDETLDSKLVKSLQPGIHAVNIKGKEYPVIENNEEFATFRADEEIGVLDDSLSITFYPEYIACDGTTCSYEIRIQDYSDDEVCLELDSIKLDRKDGNSFKSENKDFAKDVREEKKKDGKICNENHERTIGGSFEVEPGSSGKFDVILPLLGKEFIIDPYWTTSVTAGNFSGFFNNTVMNNSGDLMLRYNNSLLLHCDGADGGTVFTDSSGYGKIISGYYVTTNTTDKKFGTAACYFRGSIGVANTDSRILFTRDQSTNFSDGDFTIDFWLNQSQNSTVQGGGSQVLFMQSNSVSAGSRMLIISTNSRNITWSISTSGDAYTTTVHVCPEQVGNWTHYAFVRNGTSFYGFCNGVKSVNFTDTKIMWFNTAGSSAIGDYAGSTGSTFNGSIDEFRITKGYAQWTENFTVPTAPYADGIVLPRGYYEQIFDAGVEANFSSINWNTSYTNGNDSAARYNFSVGVCDDAFCAGDAYSFENITNATSNAFIYNFSIPKSRYFRYRVDFESDDVNASAMIPQVNVWFIRNITQSTPFLNSTNSRNDTLADLMCYNQSTYGLNVTNWYDWYKNGTRAANYNVSVLLHMDGNDDGKIFIDSSDNHIKITPINNVHTNQSSKKFGTASAYFDGVDDWLNFTKTDKLQLGSENFTIDFWINWTLNTFNSTAARKSIGGTAVSSSAAAVNSTYGGWLIWFVDGGDLAFRTIDASDNSDDAPVYILDYFNDNDTRKWMHIAFTREGNDWYIFKNGELIVNKTTTESYSIKNATNSLAIGGVYYLTPNGVAFDYIGFIDEFRVTKGQALWTDDFIPDTSPYLDTGSETLDSSFTTKDDSWGCCINISDVDNAIGNYACSNNVTIMNIIPIQAMPLLNATTSLNYTTDNLTVFNVSTYDIDGDNVVNNYTWYRDGSLQGSSNLSLLLHFDGADGGTAFIDSSPYNHHTNTVGSTKTNQTAKMFGTASAYFDGSTDYVNITKSPAFDLNNESFTIDFWFNYTAATWNGTNGRRALLGNSKLVSLTTLNGTVGGWDLWFADDGDLNFYIVNNATNASVNPVGVLDYFNNNSPSNWTHIAVVRNGSDYYLFKDGGLIDTGTSSVTIKPAINNFLIGAVAYGDSIMTTTFWGFIDEVRIVKGQALWTANFIPPKRYVSSADNNTIPWEATTKNETWYACITPNDGIEDGNETCSQNLTIANTPPIQAMPLLNATTSLNYTTDNLTVYNASTSDDDSDSIKNICNWKRNGTSIALLNMPFEGGSSSTWAKDYSGYGNNATVLGATWSSATGYDGKGAYSFDGVDDYISIPDSDSLDLGTQFTIEGRFKSGSAFNRSSDYYQGLFDKGSYQLYLDKSDGKLKFYMESNQAKRWANIMNGTEDYVYGMAVYDGELYVGGYFADAGGVGGTSRIARWNGTDWRNVTNGTTSLVYGLAVYNGELYVGGDFTNAGGVGGTNYIARWNGTDWRNVTNGTQSTVTGLAVYNGELYVGGDFTNAGGVGGTKKIARWNGTDWRNVSNGTENMVLGMAAYNGELYVGGYFADAGGVGGTRFIARWNGTGWRNLTNGTESYVYGMAAYNGELYVSGLFADAGGVGGTRFIARWNGTGWRNLTNGTQNGASGMAVYNGELYVGGSFTDAGGVGGTNKIARWNGTDWRNVTNGTQNDVLGMSVYNGELYVGGDFSDAGGVGGTTNIARWSSGNDTEIGSATNHWQSQWQHYAITYNGSNLSLYINGAYESSAIKPITLNKNSFPLLLGKTYGSKSAGFWSAADGDYQFNGSLDEIRIYNISLSSEQIKALFNNRTDLIVVQETTKNEIWQSCITPNDGQNDGNETCSQNLTIANYVPAFTFTNITPIAPNQSTNLSVNITVSDADSDLMTVVVNWFVNSILAWWEVFTNIVSGTTITSNLSAANFSKGDNITVEFVASDGQGNATPKNTSAVNISNTAPTIPINITPTNGTFGNEVNISCYGATDDDSDTLLYNIQGWFNASQEYGWWNISLNDNDGNFSWNTTGVLAQSNVTLRCLATDVESNSTWLLGQDLGYNISILHNLPPTQNNPTITPSPAFTNATLTCNNQSTEDSTDSNVDEVTNFYEWFKEGAPLNITTSTLGQGNFTHFDNITCRITPFDGLENGTSKNSSKMQILNTVPSIPTLSAPPAADFLLNHNTTFNWTVAVDNDTDAIIYNLIVSNNSGFTNSLIDINLSGIGHENKTIPVMGLGNRRYYWKVRSFDGYNYSTFTSARYFDIDYAKINITSPANNKLVYATNQYNIFAAELLRYDWIENVSYTILGTTYYAQPSSAATTEAVNWTYAYTVPNIEPQSIRVEARAFNNSDANQFSVSSNITLKLTRLPSASVGAPALARILPTKTMIETNGTVNLSVVVRADTLVNETIATARYPDGNILSLSTCNETTVGLNYTYNYTFQVNQTGAYLFKFTVIDINDLNASANITLKAAVKENINISSLNAIRIKIRDINTGEIFLNGTINESQFINMSMPPGQYAIEVTFVKPLLTLNEASINDSTENIAEYLDLEETATPPTNRRSVETFVLNATVNFTNATIVLNYSYMIASIANEENLEVWKAESTAGPWTKLTATINTETREITATTTGFSVFMIAEPTSITTATTPGASSGGTTTTTSYITLPSPSTYMVISAPSPVRMTSAETLTVPVRISNTAGMALEDVKLIVRSNSTDISPSLSRNSITELAEGGTAIVDLTLSSHTLPGYYLVFLDAFSTNPVANASKIVIVDLYSQDNETGQSRLSFARDLFNKNPECLELRELLSQAEQKFNDGDSEGSLILTNDAITGCSELIRTREPMKEEPNLLIQQIIKERRNFTIILLATVAFMALLGYLMWSPKNRRKILPGEKHEAATKYAVKSGIFGSRAKAPQKNKKKEEPGFFQRVFSRRSGGRGKKQKARASKAGVRHAAKKPKVGKPKQLFE